MVRTTTQGRAEPEQLELEEQICPLCINELDETEKAWLPCSCGYQLCLFCYDRLKTEFSNRCPNCRVEYDSDFQAGLRRRQERAAQLQREAAAEREAAKAAALAAAERPNHKLGHPPPPPPPPRTQRSPRSPRQGLRIEQEQLWPALGAPQAVGRQAAPPAPQQRPSVAAPLPELASPPRLAAILPQPALGISEQEASSSSSADTAATTPQSPVCSVVAFRALAPGPACAYLSTLASAPTAAAEPVPLHGQCSVLLQRGGGLGVGPDPEGASLAASLQEAVRAGSLSVKQAAASLASHLRQRQLHATASNSSSSSPARGSGQPSSVGSNGAVRVTPFSLAVGGLPACVNGGGLPVEAGLAPCDSALTTATSASLGHWASSGTLPMSSAQPGALGGWQQPHPAAAPLAGSPVRDGDRLPLFMRRGTLPAGPSTAVPSVGSPGSASGSSAASFPGFPSGSSSPTQELKRTLLPPPGFGPAPLGGAGIAALPRFR